MSEGELQAIEVIKTKKITEEVYYKIISDKTAALLATCTKIGAASVTDDKEVIRKMEEFGENIGMAFQLKDDLFDYLSTSSLIGKPVGNDIIEKKITLPLIHAFENSTPKEAKKIRKMIRKGGLSNKQIRYIIDYAVEYKGIDYTKAKADYYVEEAIKSLESIADIAEIQPLRDLADFIVNREN
jgi:octaprenyl-diphosphate synthase